MVLETIWMDVGGAILGLMGWCDLGFWWIVVWCREIRSKIMVGDIVGETTEGNSKQYWTNDKQLLKVTY